MNAPRIILLLLFFITLSNQHLKAQIKRTIKGSVKDSTNQAIPGSNIRIISGKDTLSVIVDLEGDFSISNIKTQDAELLIRSIGYKSYASEITFQDKQKEVDLGPIILKTELNMLNEVVIKGKITPIRVMTDTIEYNADAFMIREGDYVEDLLKQFPGMVVDDNGKVTSMGKELTRLRINGKDFFTSNVKEFIKKLPSNIFSHVQVIDDYGDEANFTGIKVGEPKKILNLVTKAGMDKGTFGNLGTNAATNDSYGVNGNGNVWRKRKQMRAGGSFNNTNNEAQINNNAGAWMGYSDNITKKLYLNSGYNFNNENNENTSFSSIETINTLGTINSVNENKGSYDNNGHSINLGLNNDQPGKFFQTGLNVSISESNSKSLSSSLQSGVIRQDFLTGSSSKQNNPNLNLNSGFGLNDKEKKWNISFNFSGRLDGSKSDQDILTDIDYYDQVTNEKVKDSLLNRLVEAKNNSRGLNGGFNYSRQLSNPKDTLKKSIELSYSFNLNSTNNELSTRVKDVDGKISFIDSLSNLYRSTFINHNLRAGYRYNSKKLNYNIGFTFQPSVLTGSYEGRGDKINQRTFNSSPSANFSYLISKTQSIRMDYSGSSNAPRFEQLQPVPDTRNLQNVIIGNPDLKTSFRHSANIGYSLFGITTGRSLQIGINATAIQNQVANNIILVKDTLNGLKQETRFLNVNGDYNINGNYSASVPFAKRKIVAFVSGNFGLSNNVLFTDNVKNNNKGFNYNQSAGIEAQLKWLAANASASYSYNENSYTVSNFKPRNLESWSFNMNCTFKIRRSFSTSVDASKNFTSGYTSGPNNPLLINASVFKSLFKNNRASVTLRANDLLNQGNNLNRMITENSIIESRTKQITRYFLVTFSLNMENFGI